MDWPMLASIPCPMTEACGYRIYAIDWSSRAHRAYLHGTASALLPRGEPEAEALYRFVRDTPHGILRSVHPIDQPACRN